MFNAKSVKVATIWSTVEATSSALLSIVSILFLARILSPNDYGQIATAQFISILIQLVLSLGISEAVIQKKELKAIDISSAFFGSVILGSVAFIFCIFCGAVFYYKNFTILAYIMGFEAITAILNIILIVPSALLLRNLEMKSFAKRTLISRILFFVVAIPLALEGFGLWSIVYANLAQVFISFILVFIASQKFFTPTLNFKLSKFLDLIRFGFFIMLENLLWSVMTRVFGLMIASFHGAAALGLYNMATRLTDAILNILNTIVTRMALPVFSAVQDDKNKLLFSFQSATYYFNLISMTTFGCMAITASYWIPLILGDKWSAVIPVLQIIAVMYAIMYTRMFVGVAVKAVGKSKNFLYLSFIAAIITMCAAFFTRHLTLIDTLLALAIPRILITIPLGIWLLKKICDFNLSSQIIPVKIPSLIAITIVAIVFIIQKTVFFPTAMMSLITQILVGVTVFIAILFVLFKLDRLKFKA